MRGGQMPADTPVDTATRLGMCVSDPGDGLCQGRGAAAMWVVLKSRDHPCD